MSNPAASVARYALGRGCGCAGALAGPLKLTRARRVPIRDGTGRDDAEVDAGRSPTGRPLRSEPSLSSRESGGFRRFSLVMDYKRCSQATALSGGAA